MERTHSRTGGACNNTNVNGYLSYSDLFNLESLMNFQLPQQSDDFDSSGNSSQNESRSSQGAGDMLDHVNGFAEDRSTDSGMSRRRWQPVTEAETESASNSSMREEPDSNDEDDGNFYNHISEEHYRSMLGEHVQKYQRMRYRNSTLNRIPTRAVAPVPKRNHSKVRKSENPSFSPKEERVAHNVVNSSEYYDIASQYGDASSMDSLYLDIGEGIAYRIPPTYDKLAKSLRLPSLSDIKIDENYLKGNLDMQSLSAMIAIDRKYHFKSNSRMGDPFPQYESLQAKLKALPACNSAQKFSLQVCEIGLDSTAIPEGAAGKIRRLILSESGILEVHYVRIMEKGDTYEIIERSLPKKQVVVKDPLLVEKEMMEKISKNWANIARKDIAKHHRIFTSIHRKQLADAKRWSETCQKEVKLKINRSLRYMKQASIRTRKLTRDALVFMKRMEKEQAELKKKEEKEAAEALKREEELRETKRQQQRLNFLISQTELYSHFMQNKPTPQVSETLTKSDEESALPVPLMSANKTGEEEDAEDAELKREALKAAQLAVSQQKRLTDAFDSECQRLRQVVEPDVPATDAVATGSSNIDLLHPSTMPLTSSVQTPEMFKGTLKEYQLKGLQWLVNCYEQGLNGILADEMGLGKTIQAMAFLGHLAEEKNIWGPFLVVAPSSVLNNWVDEVNRFCPELKTLPYWGGAQERAVLRKNINPKRLYRRESAFHILITSYQLLVYDEKCLRRVKWQYMVLDEAQAIKSSSSIRWKTLLSFNCRNRLLLTGTPIQNNMAELWALLHFIMPTLFDSHEQFNEWFSKGIENHAEHGGTLNEHQLSRLHAVLKPFMLRRVKKDVISEMTGKTEVTVHCKLSSRQQAFYQAIKNKISLTELIDVSRGSLNEKKFLNLMNIVIQLRKVCNHPELFERNEGSSYAYFAEIPFPLLSPPFGELEVIHYPGGWNPIKYKVPKLVHQEIVRHRVSNLTHFCGAPSYILGKLNIFLPQNVYNSTLPHDNHLDKFSVRSGAFGFTRLIEFSPAETYFLVNSSVLERLLFSVMRWDRIFLDEILDMFLESEGDTLGCDNLEKTKVRAVSRLLITPTKSDSYFLRRKFATGPGHAPFEALVVSHKDRFMSNTRLLRSIYSFIPRARAPPINAICSDRSFAQQGVEELHNPWIKRLLLGFARTSEFNGPHMPIGPHHLIEEIDSQLSSCQPILQLPYEIFGSSPPIQNFDPAKMLTESGKLKMLDILLKGLRAENHRVLLFAQMTKMLDILEDYMNYRKYKYLRLDGSSSIGDRRDMVWDFQNRSDIFVFLLSTRAGGLGINLTAADTVIFYESDWNPTLDLQAMDRAHRLGQTKEVTVYRLICQETVEEKILQRASQKNTVQQLVMTGGHVQDDLLKSEDVVSLLLDDSQLQQKLREIPAQVKDRQKKKRPAKGVRITADGDATIENLDQDGLKCDESVSELENGATTTKKRKSVPKAHVSNLKNRTKVTDMEPGTEELKGDLPTLPRRTKKAKKEKSVNEYLESVGGLPSESDQQVSEYPPHSQYFESPIYGNGEELGGYISQTPSPSPG